jgi:ribose transport system substrate-binding protein
MNRNRTAVVTLTALTALSLAACNRAPASDAGGTGGAKKHITIGLAVANLQADFFNQIKQSVEAEAKKSGATVRVADAGGDSATQVNQMQDFITRQVDAIIYIPAGATAAGVPVKAAKRAHIPVIAVDRNAPDAPGDTFIATDSVAAANVLGHWVVKAAGGKGQLAILQGQIGTTPQVDRQKGFEQALSTAPGIKVVAQQPADWAQDKAFSVAQDMLQAKPDINIFWGQADAMALGAAQAVKNANVKHKVIIAGFDGDFAGLKGVRAGTVDATMVQQTQLMGRLAVQSALDITAGKTLPKTQLQKAFLLTKADPKKADEYIAQHP